jgi:phenylacetate-CoA ligase
MFLRSGTRWVPTKGFRSSHPPFPSFTWRTHFPILKSINGRVSERLVTRSGREIHDIFFIHTLARVPGVAKFQVVQKSLDLIQVNLELENGIARETIAVRARAELQELGEHQIEIAIKFVDNIPLTDAGKLRHFICEVVTA